MGRNRTYIERARTEAERRCVTVQERSPTWQERLANVELTHGDATLRTLQSWTNSNLELEADGTATPGNGGVAQNESHEGKRKCESVWPIFQITHQRSRYIYDLYYKRKAISKELYEFCLKEKYADRHLIAKWKKPGYERLCCLRCIQTADSNFQTTCICRVPKSQLPPGQAVQCVNCGCRGCASCDGNMDPFDEE